MLIYWKYLTDLSLAHYAKTARTARRMFKENIFDNF